MNPDFDIPQVPSHLQSIINTSIYGWTASHQLEVVNIQRMCVSYSTICSVSFEQALDMDSDIATNTYSQTIQIENEG